MQGLDYSAGRLSGADICAAGYDFVVRYVGTPGRLKNITHAEYQDLTASGVAVALVYENTAGDALYGRLAGQASARTARADADAIGFPANRPIYFAVDFQVAPDQMPTVMAYLDGAADVLGVDQVGVYGFLLTISAAMNGGHAHWFWQCGAHTALVHGSHLYQHNNDNTSVSGITCDVNDALTPDFGQTPMEDDMLTPEQDTLLRDVHEQLCGDGSRAPGSYPGWGLWSDPATKLTAVDMLRRLDQGQAAIEGSLSKAEVDLLAALKALPAASVDAAALATALTGAGLPTEIVTALLAALNKAAAPGGTK